MGKKLQLTSHFSPFQVFWKYIDSLLWGEGLGQMALVASTLLDGLRRVICRAGLRRAIATVGTQTNIPLYTPPHSEEHAQLLN